MGSSTKPIEGTEYVHYKGGKYLILFVVDDSTNAREGNKVVVYKSFETGAVHARDLSEFIEPVTWPDGATRPRFVPAETA